jgi:hypothetical protein
MNGIRNWEEFADAVERMRASQRDYLRKRDHPTLMRRQKKEAAVDLFLAERKGLLIRGIQPGLFGGQP